MTLLRAGGPPAVVVPLLGTSPDQVFAHAHAVAVEAPDVVEWRLDAWGEHDAAGAVPLLPRLRAALPGLPLLATFRSRAEGGPGELTDQAWVQLVIELLDAGVEAVDVEVSRGTDAVARVVAHAREVGAVVVGSSHDFAGTATDDALDATFDALAALGADVLKVAVAPENLTDVLRLLAAGERARRHGRAVLPVAMGEAGVLTRFAGEVWGAPATFALVGSGSAPGQVPVAQIRRAQEQVHAVLTAGGAS